MIKGVGVDIVRVDRVREALGKKVLVGNEEFGSNEHFAGLWAVKEAVLKALGCGIGEVSFRDIEIVYNQSGAPMAILNGAGQDRLKKIGGSQIFVSVSHEKEYAVGMAVIE